MSHRSPESHRLSSPSNPTTAPSQWGRTTSGRQDPSLVCSFDVKLLPGRSWLKYRQRRTPRRSSRLRQRQELECRKTTRAGRSPRNPEPSPLPAWEHANELARFSVASGSRTCQDDWNPERRLKEKPMEAGCGTRLQYQGTYTNPTYGKKP